MRLFWLFSALFNTAVTCDTTIQTRSPNDSLLKALVFISVVKTYCVMVLSRQLDHEGNRQRKNSRYHIIAIENFLFRYSKRLFGAKNEVVSWQSAEAGYSRRR
jgi:hypothetical protein